MEYEANRLAAAAGQFIQERSYLGINNIPTACLILILLLGFILDILFIMKPMTISRLRWSCFHILINHTAANKLIGT